MENEVFDAEQYGIIKATELALNQVPRNPLNTSDIYFYCDSQAAVRWMADPTAKPGQQLVIEARTNILRNQNTGIVCHIH